MASVSEEDLCCPVCQDIYRDPVVLSCSHSFCRVCIENWWRTRDTRECPVCKRRIFNDPPPNLALRNICESFMKLRTSDSVCVVHREEFKLFCEDHLQPLCVVCGHSELHSGHKIRPIQEAATVFKTQLQETLKPLKNHIQDLHKNKDELSMTMAHIGAQARLTERQIQDQFKRLHQFLEEEEQARIRAVREEEEIKRKSMKDKMEAVSREIEALSKTITDTEEQLRAEDDCFLLQYKTTVERVQHCPLVEGPQLGPGALIEQAKHLGNLGFHIWNKMKDLFQFYPVILDPNTAAPELTLSDDLSSVRSGEIQKLPENPERFQKNRVVGSEGFTSGIYSWDVEVSGNKHWTVGVVSETVQRRGDVKTGLWVICLIAGKYFSYSSPGPLKPLPVKKTLQRVRVKLDVDRVTLCFSDADTNTQLHTFTHSFTDRLFPYFRTRNDVPLKVLPVTISVTVET